MKKKLLFGAGLIFIAWGATSCESLGDCEFCRNVTYEDGVVINEGPEIEYCGAELLAQKSKPDIVIGSLTTKVVCR